MSQSYTVKPTHKPIKDYYAALATFSEHRVDHEQAVRAAFANLLTATGKKHGWTLIAEEHLRGHPPRPSVPKRQAGHAGRCLEARALRLGI